MELYLALGELDGNAVFETGLRVDKVDAVSALGIVTALLGEVSLAIETHANLVIEAALTPEAAARQLEKGGRWDVECADGTLKFEFVFGTGLLDLQVFEFINEAIF